MVSLMPSPGQAALDAALRELLDAECPTSRVRAAAPLGFDAALWSAVASVSGAGEGVLDLMTAVLLAETIGRYLAPIPFVEHIVSRRAFERAGARVPEGVLTLTVADPVGRLVPAGAIADHVVAVVDEALVDLVGGPTRRPVRNLADLPLADRATDGGVEIDGPRADAEVHARAVAEWLGL